MKTIHKYPIPVGRAAFGIEMHAGAQILSVQMQRRRPTIWALVNTTAPMRERTFRVYGTGEDMPWRPDVKHLATVQDGACVWHVFESFGEAGKERGGGDR